MSKELVISASPHETRVAIVEDGQLCEIYVEREKEFALVGSIYKGRVTRVLPGMQSAFVDIGLDSDAFLYVSDFLEGLEEYDNIVTTVEGKVQKMEQQGGRVFAPATNGGAAAPAAEPPEVAAGEASEAPAEAPAYAHAESTEPAENVERPAAPAGSGARSDDLPGERRASASESYAAAASAPPAGDRDRGGFRGGRGGYGRGRDRGDRGDRGGRGGRGRFGRRGGRDDRDRRHGRDFPASKYAMHRPYEPADSQTAGEAEAPPSSEPILLPGESLAKYRERPASAGASASTLPAEANLRVEPIPPAQFDELHAEAEAAKAAIDSNAAAPESESAVELASAAAARSLADADSESDTAEVDAWQGPAVQAPMAAPPADEQESSYPSAAALRAEHDAHPAEEHLAEPELTDDQAIALAQQLAEVEQEAQQAESAELNPELDDAEAVAEAEADAEAAAEAAELHDEEEDAENEPATSYEIDETDQEIRQGILDAANGEVDSQPESPVAGAPSSARMRHNPRARFQRPMRRGGRGGRGGGRPHRGGGRPHHGHGHGRPQAPRRPQLISELLKAGQEIIVQIAKEPLGKKGARITSHVALPGRFLVYMPTVDHIGVSRKIASSEKRSRLRHLVNEAKGTFPGGFIVRTAAEGATDEEIRTDVEFLGRTWSEIRQRSEQRKAPAILHRDLNLVERILRDHMSNDYTAIWIDNEEEFTKVVEFVGRFQPGLVSRVKLYTKDAPIFEEFGIQQEIDKSLRPKVWLKSGGYIVINHTEALVAIDVNTGKFVGKGSTRLEDTIVRTNIEAVKEVVRQIRLRDLGGIIVVDFIDMEERRNREKVMQALDDALRADRAPSKVLPFNEFGLVAITRKRTKQALERVLCQPCPYCSGSGMVKSLPTICYEIQAEARKMAAELDSGSLTLRVNPEIAKALKTRESALVEELEHWVKKSVIIQSDPTLHWEQYDIY